MTKEEVYDEQISPLMTQIITICEEHRIAMLCHFEVPTPDDNGLTCLSALPTPEYDPSDYLLRALEILRPREASPMMITVKDGNGNITSMEAVL